MTPVAHRGEIVHFLDDPRNDDHALEYIQDGILLIEEGHVAACQSATTLLGALPQSTTVIEHTDCLIVPGFIDTHVHFPQVDVIASHGAQLLEWLETYTFPAERKLGDRAHATEVAEFFLDELLRNGTTTALVFGTSDPVSVDSFFECARARSLRMICGKVMMDRNAPDYLCDTPETSRNQSQDLIDRWHGVDRLGYAVTPRFAPTSTPDQLAVAGDLLRTNPGVHLHTHTSENRDECKWVQSLFPERSNYIDVYDHYGLLGKRSVLAHGIHLCQTEWKRLAQTNSTIAFCPTSNLFIGSGLFDLKKAEEIGVTVGIGTDVGGGDSYSILRTLNEAYKVQQLRGYNLGAKTMLYLATLGGAKSLNLESCIGNFDKGKEADFVILDKNATSLISRRTRVSQSIEETLFALAMLGDDRLIKSTYALGKLAHART
ncbi:MAG: guanine deaminase [Pseudomonadota bacterium]